MMILMSAVGFDGAVGFQLIKVLLYLQLLSGTYMIIHFILLLLLITWL